MFIPAAHGLLEANLRPATGPRRGAAVLCHPHPEHGGTMHTKAVFRTAQALSDVGFDVLRFNFRGVGASTGSYGEGVGEAEDVRTVLDWLSDDHPAEVLLLGGFSFGARIALQVGATDPTVNGLLGLGLPLDMYDFGFLESTGKPILLIQGEHDEFGGDSEFASFTSRLDGEVDAHTVSGADHYFTDHFAELQAVVREYFTEGPGATHFAAVEPSGGPAWNPPDAAPRNPPEEKEG